MSNLISDIFHSIFYRPSEYLTYKEGKTNLILAAPHGGSLKPLNIPYRKWGKRSRDTYTRTLLRELVSIAYKKPYYIYSNLHRSRLDLNRDIYEAAQNNRSAEKVWYNWQNTVTNFISQIRRQYIRGLFIDIHSHNSSDKFQIGYGLPVKDYLRILSGKKVTALSTLSPLLFEDNQYDILFGDGSFPNTLDKYGFEVLIPSTDQEYLSGGRNIRVYSGGGIGSIQIECPISILNDNLSNVALVLNDAIEIFNERFVR